MDHSRNLTTQNLLSTLDGETGDLLTQGFTGLHSQLICFCLGIGDDLVGFSVARFFASSTMVAPRFSASARRWRFRRATW